MWHVEPARLVSRAIGILAFAATVTVAEVVAQGGQTGNVPVPAPGRNVNMVSGTGWPDGDPFLQRQNEPSLAASTRNPLHLLGGSNDYRTVDIPGLPVGENGDAWLGVFKSFDGGITWKSSLLPGYPQDTSAQGMASPLHGLNAAADSTVRAGTNGLFYFSGMAFDRNTSSGGKVFAARFIDNNNKEKGDTIQYLGTVAIDVGTSGQFLDKPALVVDVPRGNATCSVPGQAAPIPAGPVYVIWSVFVGNQTPPGQAKQADPPTKGRSQILVAKSSDCGATFSKPQKISERFQLNQGSVAAIDPNTGALYVGWREFAASGGSDTILVSRSTDFGGTFSPAVTVAQIAPFDQGSSSMTFRTQSMPTMAVDAGDLRPDGSSSGPGRVHIAWAESAASPDGDSRIVVASSADGKTWTSPIVADTRWLKDPLHPELAPTRWRGHQLMPALTFSGGRLQLVYYDFRNDASGIFNPYDPVRHVGVSEGDVYTWNTAHPTDQRKRHTVDVFSVHGIPGLPPQFGPSVSVSRYLEGQRHKGDPLTQLQFNAVNLPLFAGGTIPFLGDYLDIAATPPFILDPNGKWRFNTKPSDSQASVAVWADNRDVRGPPAGKTWKDYTAPTFANSGLFSQFDPTQQLQACSEGTAGMRNQNIYSARIASGVTLTVLGNNKPLGFGPGPNGAQRLIQRTFVVVVGNPDATSRSVVLHIGAQPPGGMASFLQFRQSIDLPVTIAPRSTISREVFVTSTNRHASVPVTVTDTNTSAITAAAVLNPDITNPDITNPDITNPDITNPDITNAEAHAVSVSNPDITNPDITNPDITNPDITNPDITNPDITNPDITNPDITNPDITNPDITNPDITNPDITNPDITNSSLTDVTWSVVNQGNTATSYQMKLLLADAKRRNLLLSGAKLQLVITKTSVQTALGPDCKPVAAVQNTLVTNIKDPAFVDPSNAQQFSTVVNPDITNPDITNATVALAPGDTAYVTLRVFSPIADGDTTTGGGPNGGDPLKDLTGALEELKSLGVATTSYSVDTIAADAGSTTPKIDASIPLITTTTPPDGVRTVAYVTTIDTVGGAEPRTLAVATGSLPPGIVLNAATGALTGTPLAAGAFTFVARVTDANGVSSESTLTIRIFEPLVVVTTSLPGGVVNQPYTATLGATGGFAPYAWTVTGGALPAGITLSAAGLLSGTPTQSGTFAVTAAARDAAVPAQVASASLTLDVTPTANAQAVTVVEDTATPIALTGTGAPAASFAFAIGSQPAHGTLSGTGPVVTYTPASNYNGPDSFTFRVLQGTLASAFATVSITVAPVNDAPTATPLTVTTPQVTPVQITLSGTDPENSALSYTMATQPSHGSLTGTAPGPLTYTPQNNFSGNDSFTFSVSDGQLQSAPAAVTIIVGNPPANSADVTAALAGPSTIALGGVATYTATIHNNGPAPATNVVLNVAYPSADLALQSATPSQGSCAVGPPLVCTVGSIASGANAVVTIAAKAFNHGGAVSITATASATTLDYNTSNNAATQTTTISGPATATTDLAVNQAAAPPAVDFGGNAVYTVTVTNNGPSDATGVALTNSFTASAAFVSFTAGQGACSIAGSQLSCSVGSLASGATAVYTLTLKAAGTGAFSSTATVTGSQSDPAAANNSSTVSVSVNNRVPTAADDSASLLEDGSATIAVLANDADPDVDPLTVTAVSAPGHGSAARNGDNTITYTAAADYFGSDSFTYTIADGRGGTATATVAVSVLAVNDPPSFTGGPDQTVAIDAAPRTVPGWATAISKGPENEAAQHLTFVLFNTNHALFSVQPSVAVDGTLTYAAAPGASGSSTATVVLHDDGGTANGGGDSSAPFTFTITVAAIPPDTPPVAADDAYTTNEDTPFTPGGASCQAPVSFADFANVSTLQVNGTAQQSSTTDGAVLRLVQAAEWQGGSTFTTARIGIATFSTQFQFRMTGNGSDAGPGGYDGSGAGADGFTFALQSAGPTALGGLGGDLGYGSTPDGVQGPVQGIAPSVAVEFDTLQNGAWPDVSSNHVGIDINGDMVSVQAQDVPGRFDDGQLWTGWIDYDGQTLEVRVSPTAVRPASPTLSRTMDLAGLLGGNTAFAGFTAATGLEWENIDIVNWTYGACTPGVLTNDTDAEGEALTAAQVSAPQHGELQFNPNGTFTYTPSAQFFGTDSFTYRANDGHADSNVATVTITVNPVNDPPTFTKGPDETVPGNGSGQLFPTWATGISAGTNETGQAVTFIVSADNPALFATPPAINAAGDLSFQPALGASGVTTVTVQAHDDGGTANGGVDTSSPQTFTITVSTASPTVVTDTPTTTSGTAVTFYPAANDTDVYNPSPLLLATVRFPQSTAPNLPLPAAIAVLPKPSSSAPGIAYFGASGRIGILDTTLGEVVGAIPLVPAVTPTLARANLTTRLVYFAAGNRLFAVDGRPSSPTYHQVVLSLTIGSSLRTLTLDETRGRLYVTSQSNSGTGSVAQSQVTVLDVDPSSPAFHQIVGEVSLPAPSVLDAAVNTITNKLYIGVSATNGLVVLDGATLTLATVSGVGTTLNVAVNETSNLIYAAFSQVTAIDGATDTKLATIDLPFTGIFFTGDGRLAIHNGTGRVFYRVSNTPQNSVVAVIDGDRNSPTFNTLLTQIPAGWETSAGFLAVDQATARVIFTTPGSLSSTIVNAQTDAVVGTIHATQVPARVAVDASTGTAWVTGAVGLVQAINLSTATAQLAQTGVEVALPIVDPISHAAFVPKTGFVTRVAVIDATGLQAPVTPATDEGRFVFAARNGTTNRIYAANFGANAAGTADAAPGFVSVIDAGTRNVVASVPVGSRPFGIAVDDVLNKVYVGNTSVANDISANYQTWSGITVIDGATNAATPADLHAIVAGPLSVQQQMAVNTATGKMYFRIAGGASTTIGVLDGATNIGTPLPASLGPVSIIRVNPILNRVYVGSATGVLHVLDGATDAELATLTVGGASSVIGTQSYLAVNRATGRVYVANFSANTLSVIDGTTNAIVATIPVGRGPTSVAVNETSNRVYVANALDRTLMLVNGATARVESIVTLPMQPVWLAVDESASQIYAAGGCPSGSSICTSFETGVMVLSDPGSPNSPLTIISVTQGASGSVVLNADGSVSYTPNAGFNGDDTFAYTVSDSHGGTSTGTVHVTINSLPVITTASLPPGLTGQSYAQTLAASGGTVPYAWTIAGGQLPPGLYLDATTGAIGGTAVGSGTFTPTFQVRDSLGNVGSSTLTIVVGPPVILTLSVASGFLGQPYSQTLTAGGNIGTPQWSIAGGALPSGLTLSPGGVISGAPTAYGTAFFTVQVQDSLGRTATRPLSLFVDANLTITTTTLNEGILFSSSNSSISTIGGHGTRVFSIDSGSLPPGVTLSSSGSFSGAPNVTGPFSFVVRVTDCTPSTSCGTGTAQQTATQAYTQNVSAPDQSGSSNTSSPGFTFGGPGGLRIAERVTTGLTGSLRGFRVVGISCPAGTTITVDVQGVATNGGPDGTTVATGAGLVTSGATILFSPVPVFEADQPFTVVVGSSAACTAQPSTFDSYNGGEGFVGSPWQPLADYSAGSYFDIPFQTLVQPAAGLSYMSTFRSQNVAVTLNNGSVLVTSNGTAEIFDPGSATFTATGGLSVARNNFTGTLLNDGTVLVVGGTPNAGGAYLNTAELYHADTGQWELLPATMTSGRYGHTATKLSCPAANPSCSWNGKVLIAGGYYYNGTTTSPVTALELYDPTARSFSTIGSISAARYIHTATPLQCSASNPSCGWDSFVLLTGGYLWSGTGASAEIVNPATGTSTPTSGAMGTPRAYATATSITDGRVLIAGGVTTTGGAALIQGAELFDPQSGHFTPAGSMLSSRFRHSASALADGSVLIAGGVPEVTNRPPVASMERFVPGTGFVGAGSLAMTRQVHSAATLQDGRILMVGGVSNSSLTGRAAEIVDPVTGPSLLNPILPTGALATPYSAVVAPKGGSGQPYTFTLASSAQALPPGLSLDSFTCLVGCSVTIGTNVTAPITIALTAPIQLARLSGTPTVAGNYSFDLRVTDSANHSADQTLTIRINPLDITTPQSLPNAYLGVPFSKQLTASGTGTLTWSLVPGSVLPPGLSLSSAGVLSGTLTSTNFTSFTVRVTDAFGQTVTRQFSLSVSYWTDQTHFGDGVSSNTLPIAGGSRVAQTVSTGVTGYLGGLIFPTLTCSTNPVTVTIQGISPTTGAPDDSQILATTTATITQTSQTIPLSPSLFFAVDAKFAIVLSSPSGSCQVTNASVGSDLSMYQGGAAFQDLGGGWTRLTDGPTGIADIQFQTIATNDALVHTTYLGDARAVRLLTGSVLAVGDNGSATLYNPTTNTAVIKPMLARRAMATLTLLNSGKVLVTGGVDQRTGVNTPWVYYATAEIYDPALDTFQPVAGTMSISRYQHQATLLADGRVLITGGLTQPADPATTQWGPAVKTAEIFDPIGNTFTAAASMLDFRNAHQATRLGDGRVLVTGGFGGSTFPYVSAELYTPWTDAWTAAGSMLTPRANHQATRLADGTVLISGGYVFLVGTGLATTGEIFDPATNAFATAGPMREPRMWHTSTLLPDGSVLITGGIRNPEYFGAPWAAVERYVKGTGFVGAASLLVTRNNHAAVLMPDGRVVVGGGYGSSSQSGNSLEIYDPRPNTGAPGIVNPNAPDGAKDVPYGPFTFAPTGGAGQPYTLALLPTAQTLPPGLAFDVVSCVIGCTVSDGTPVSSPIQLGRIQGTPTASGTYPFGVRVTDKLGHSSDQTLTIRIDGLDITTQFMPNAHRGQPYSSALTATGIAPVTWSVVSGSLPPGLSIVGAAVTGTVSTSVATGMSYNFTVRAVDAAGQRAVRNMWIYVQEALRITTTTMQEGILWDYYGWCVPFTNSQGAVTFTVLNGQLPAGVSLGTNGCFSGTVGAIGQFNVTVQATDQASPPQTASQFLNVHVSAPDQQVWGNSSTPALPFGASSQRAVAQVFTAGVDGQLTGISLNNPSCPASPPTQIAIQIQSVSPTSFEPTGTVLASGAGDWYSPIMVSPLTIGKGERYAIVVSTTGDCSFDQTTTSDGYPLGEAFEKIGAGAWQRLALTQGIADVPFRTLTIPTAPLTFMTTWRSRHTSTLLTSGPNAGKVLIVGGNTNSAEIYDPASGTTTATGNMSVERTDHTATLLANGKVLIAGGRDNFGNALSTAEVYDPASGTFAGTTNTLAVARVEHTATLLADGRVLLAGGYNGSGGLASVELYDSASGFSTVAGMHGSRWRHTATLLADGRVFVAGGNSNGPFPVPNGETYDAVVGTWTPTGGTIQALRARHTAALLDDGRVLLVGGTGHYPEMAPVEFFDPSTNVLTNGPAMLFPRADHAMTTSGSKLFVSGGVQSDVFGTEPLSQVEFFDQSTGQFAPAGSLAIDRAGHTAVALSPTRVLMTGGWSWSTLSGRSSEIYDADSGAPNVAPASLPDGQSGASYGTQELHPNGANPPFTITVISGSVPSGLTATPVAQPVLGTGHLDIAGTPTASGTFTFGVRIADAIGKTMVQSYTVRIDPLDITTVFLPSGTSGVAYTQSLAATGVGSIVWSAASGAGTPPPGLTVNSNGTVTGTPVAPGYYTFGVSARDSLGQVARRIVALQIQ